MEKIRVAQIEQVTLLQLGERSEGILNLTPHHIVFTAAIPPPADQPDATPRKREKWLTYPMIAYCTYRPAPPASHVAPSIRLRFRDFTFVALQFTQEKHARDAFETIKSLTCRLGRIDKLYAFNYRPQPLEKDLNGWNLYDPRKEFDRLGVNTVSDDGRRLWRFTDINANHEYSPTYPSVLVVPSTISDNVLKYAGSHRSRARIPVLTYLHPVNNCSITRSSQPMVGMRQSRNQQDEKLVSAIFTSSTSGFADLDSAPSSNHRTPPQLSPEQSSTNLPTIDTEPFPDTDALEHISLSHEGDGNKVYGAQQTNLIIDARPAINAYANHAAGMGSENMEHYKQATKAYLGIENIHVMRDSLNKVVEAVKDSDLTPLPPHRETLAKSSWLKHINLLLDGSAIIARQVGVLHSHVLIHCSDGWDRTSQLSALSQLMLDPYYRTLDGFIILVEKDWVSFGHRFLYRSGHLSSEKWFEVDSDRIGGQRNISNGGELTGPGDVGALNNAWLKAKGFFNKGNDSQESLAESDGEVQQVDQSPGSVRRSAAKAKTPAADEKMITKVKETAPIFHQFLDATYQLLHQYPTRFEFNQRFLKRLLYHAYSCQYGTFLYDNEKQRLDANVRERTRSVWDYFLSKRFDWINKQYDPAVDDAVRGKERMLFPKLDEVRWWSEAFGRKDEEMNAPLMAPASAQPSLFANGTVSLNTAQGPSTSPIGRPTTPTPPGQRDDVASPRQAVGAFSDVHDQHPSLVAVRTSKHAVGDEAAVADMMMREKPKHDVDQPSATAEAQPLPQSEPNTRSPSPAPQQEQPAASALHFDPDDPLGALTMEDEPAVTQPAKSARHVSRTPGDGHDRGSAGDWSGALSPSKLASGVQQGTSALLGRGAGGIQGDGGRGVETQ